MIPNMYKIAGELTSTVFHIAARAIASQGPRVSALAHSEITCSIGWSRSSALGRASNQRASKRIRPCAR